VYPVVVHSIWSPSGFLNCSTAKPLLGVGMIDFAGSGVVHVTGGSCALLATLLLGPRKGRFHDDRGNKLEEPKVFPGHSKSLQVRLHRTSYLLMHLLYHLITNIRKYLIPLFVLKC